MKLILARHGNTFGPRDDVVWAGCDQDLPLVSFGKEQAEMVANCFLELAKLPTHIYCGPLQRTKEFAEIVASKINFTAEIIIDSRLNELDYGLWGGMTSEEIIDSFGEQDLYKWNDQSIWSDTFFMGTEVGTINIVKNFVAELKQKHSDQDRILIVSSNGLLRYFLKLIPGEFENRISINDFKIKTGHLSVLEEVGGKFQLNTWNTSPSNLTKI